MLQCFVCMFPDSKSEWKKWATCPSFIRKEITTCRIGTLPFSLVYYISSWLVWAEIKCTIYVALLKQPIKWFQPVWQSRKQLQGAYYPMYVYCALHLQNIFQGWRSFFSRLTKHLVSINQVTNPFFMSVQTSATLLYCAHCCP